MPIDDPNRQAELIKSIHQPWKAPLGECLQRWRAFDPPTQSRSFLVLQGEGGLRRTLNGSAIAALAAELA